MPILGTVSSGRNYGFGLSLRLPVWVTTGALTQNINGASYSATVSATDPNGLSLTYSVTPGYSLPTGLSISSGGTISGTTSGYTSGGSVSFLIRATDSAGIYTDSSSLSISILGNATVTTASTSGNNNAYSNYATNLEIQRQGSLGTKSLSISGTNFRAGATVTLGGQACTSVSVASSTTINCTTPNYTFSANVALTITVTQDGQNYNSSSTVYTRKLGENVQFPSQNGLLIQNNGDTTTAGLAQYYIRPSGRSADAFLMYVAGSSYDGGGYDYYLYGGASAFNYYQQGQSCGGQNLSLWCPRSQACWQGSQAVWGWTAGTGNGGLTYVWKPGGGGNYTGSGLRQNSYYGGGYDDWRVNDGGRWWLRNSGFGEPNGDYDGYGCLQMYGNTGYEMGFNDGGAYNSGSQYVCSTNAKT
jgi:hypothetical protein